MTEDRLLTTQEVAELTGLSETTLRMWRSQGRGPQYAKFGHSVRYRASWLWRWAETHAVKPSER